MLDHSSEKSPTAVARELDLLSTPSAGGQQDDLTRWCSEAIAALPTEAQAVRDGNPKVLNKILGRVMKASGGRADAQAARTVLHDLLSTRT
jgi:aspartyl-tRNA(Asn)/glutamyl-tRNA(Gln) amidotransferase subunit B